MPEPSEANRKKGKWWDFPWSLVEGCTPVSEACDNCWLTGMARRFGGAVLAEVRFRADRLAVPLRRRKPAVFAVWSDLFHDSVGAWNAVAALRTMRLREDHTFIVLTKRAKRMSLHQQWAQKHDLYCTSLPNVILGVTAENQARLEERLPDLLATPAACRMLSVEPMLSEMSFMNVQFGSARMNVLEGCGHDPRNVCQSIPNAYCEPVNWVVLGCESGARRRPTPWAWLESAVEQCVAAGVAVWVKQMAERPDGTGRVLHDMALFPQWARRREWPLRKETER